MKFGFLSEVPKPMREELLGNLRALRRYLFFSLLRCFTVVFERRPPGMTMKAAIAPYIYLYREGQETWVRCMRNTLLVASCLPGKRRYRLRRWLVFRDTAELIPEGFDTM